MLTLSPKAAIALRSVSESKHFLTHGSDKTSKVIKLQRFWLDDDETSIVQWGAEVSELCNIDSNSYCIHSIDGITVAFPRFYENLFKDAVLDVGLKKGLVLRDGI